MNVRELVDQILTQIGFATDAGAVTAAQSRLCLDLINISILDFNKQAFLHFTKDLLSIPSTTSSYSIHGGDSIIIRNPPLKIPSLTFRIGSAVWKIRGIEMDTFPAYLDGSTGIGPRVFVYDRFYYSGRSPAPPPGGWAPMNGELVGRIRFDRRCSHDLTAVVINDMKAYESDTEALCIPPDYASMIRADVQYRLLANSDASESLKRSKEYERTKTLEGIKTNNFEGIDTFSKARYVEDNDVIRTGYGRL